MRKKDEGIMQAWNHFKTITKHKLLVMQYCFRVGLYKQGLLHDMSKYSPTEFLVGCRYYQGTRSPNNAEREDIGYSSSWLHHKGRNRHHYEYWIDYGNKGCETIITGVKMPRKYVAEMIMDRISASRTYSAEDYTDQSPLQYFLRGKSRLWFVHEDTKRDMELLLRLLAEKGEKQMLWYVKHYYLKGRSITRERREQKIRERKLR